MIQRHCHDWTVAVYRLFPLLCGSLVVFLVSFSVSLAGAAEADREDKTTVRDLDGRTHSGRLESLGDGRVAIRTGDQALQEFETADLLSLHFEQRTARDWHGAAVLLDNGDRLFVHPLRLKDDNLEARWTAFPDAAPVTIPLETVRAVLLHVPESARARTRLINQLLDRRAESDVLVLKNGDQAAGELLELDGEAALLQSAVGEVRVERDGVQAIGFDTSLISFPQPEGLRALVSLRDGTRLVISGLQLSPAGVLRGEAAFGARLEFELPDVVSLQFQGGRAVFLSDLEPAEYRFTPYLSTRWELRRDRNVVGDALRLRGREYAKGLGLHSKSEVRYRLDGRYRRFQSLAGLDDGAGPMGSVVFAVEVDGRRLFESTPQTARDPVLEIGPLDVSGAETLTLIVDFGDFGSIQDHANWCNPLLIR